MEDEVEGRQASGNEKIEEVEGRQARGSEKVEDGGKRR